MKIDNIVKNTLKNISVEVIDSCNGNLIDVIDNYKTDVIDDYKTDFNVVEIVPIVNAIDNIVIRVYIETPKVSPNDLKGAARVRALYKWLYWLEAGRDIYDNKDAGFCDFWAAMCEWWSKHEYTIDIEGNWYDESGEEIA